MGDSGPFVVVISATHRFTVTLTLAGRSNHESLVEPNSAISGINFWRQRSDGKPGSTFIALGTISYDGFAQIPAVMLAAHDVLVLNDLQDVTIQKFYYDPQ